MADPVYFAVPLGLFDLLAHLQGEQYPWNPALVANFVGLNASGIIAFDDLEPIYWKDLDRWSKNEKISPFRIKKDEIIYETVRKCIFLLQI